MKSTIVKISEFTVQRGGNMKKIVGVIDAKSVFNLIDSLDLEANPRIAKKSRVTEDILESLQTTPELFFLKSKGILVSSRAAIDMDRGRTKLIFEDEQLEGIMDGGHNTFTLALHLLQTAISEVTFKPKTWDDISESWTLYRDEVLEFINNHPESLNFKVPFEVVLPDGPHLAEYTENILDISEARNNNSELTETAKGNHAGYYNKLIDALPSEIADKVEWKTNEAGKTIKSQDIIALSMIPLLALKGQPGISPLLTSKVNMYSSKGACVKAFNNFVEDNMTEDSKPNHIEFKSPLTESAFDLMKDIPMLYDIIYKNFGDAYNKNNGSFGSIDKVTILPSSKKRSAGFYTKYYKLETNYSYPDGFIYPVVASLGALMEVRNGKLCWVVDNPEQFIKDNLTEIVSMLCQFIRSKNFDPQQVGKDSGSYQAVEMMINMVLMKSGIQKNVA